MPIQYDRLMEIATMAIEGLIADDEQEAIEYMTNEMEMTTDELEIMGFGIPKDES